MITAFAPAKINLALHVTGQREDGYHCLSSLVAFADIGDRITAYPADELSLEVTGPYAALLESEPDNLVLRAARGFHSRQGAAITLQKNLPVASGIGGGSADAAATLRALAELWDQPPPDPLTLGADVPVCVKGRACVMAGIGEQLRPFDGLPPAHLVLVNPGIAVSTPAVFQARQGPFSEALPALPSRFADAGELASWLAETRNDLEPPAKALAPKVTTVLDALAAQSGALLARMSGSGATCFGLFAAAGAAEAAAEALSAEYLDWWVKSAALLR